MPKSRVRRALERLEPRMLLAAEAIITEFMASNDTTLTDGNGDQPDWIEIHNAGDMSLDLAGWRLTDNPENLDKWTFPSRVLNPGDYLVVFASNNDAADNAGHLHTNFKLSISGDYLALVKPDGVTIVSEFDAGGGKYLPQFTDVSMGLLDVDGNTAIGFLTTPTPGAANIGPIVGHGPNILDVTHTPAAPNAGESVIVTARVEPTLGPVSSVTVQSRFGYVRPTPPVEMFDDGAHGDGAAGDGVYGATITTSPSQAGQILRYRVTAADTAAIENSVPLPLDPTGNHPTPEYFGALVQDPSIDTELPVFHWVVPSRTWHMNDPGNPNAGNNRQWSPAAVFFDGEFYDNLRVRVRGTSTTQNWRKPKFKFEFNDVHEFRYADDRERVDEFNLQSHFVEVLFADRRISYMRENIAFQFAQEVGVPASTTFHMHVRQNGVFYSLATFVEQVDATFLRRNGFDDNGPMYKATPTIQSTLAPNPTPSIYQKVTRKDDPFDDLVAFTNGINGRIPRVSVEDFLFDNVNLPEVINDMASQMIVLNHDRLTKNYYVYRDPATGEWSRFPWDTEQAFSDPPWPHFVSVLYGDSSHTQGTNNEVQFQNHLMDAILDTPRTREMYLRRVRTLIDQYVNTGYFEDYVNQTAARFGADVALDNARWGAGTLQVGLDSILSGITRRRNQLAADPLVPASDMETNIQFGTPNMDGSEDENEIVFNPISGNQDEEYITIINHGAVAKDISLWQLTGGVRHTFQPATVIPAGGTLYVSPNVAVFRSRSSGPSGLQGLFVQGGYAGHISSAGETIQLLAADGALVTSIDTPAMPSDAQRYLRITELNYNPPGSDDTEFIELTNTSDTVTLDLADVRFTSGFSEDFNLGASAVATLGPGEYVLVVKDQAAFQAAYPRVDPTLIAGEFLGSLDNSGETIKLEDSLNGTILEFRYEDGKDPGEEDWPREADAGGFSLVIVDPLAATNAWEIGNGWRASRLPGGSPGGQDGTSQPGDTDGDGDVDIDDLNNVRNNFGGVGLGDANGDGVVNIDDLNEVRNHFGSTAAAAFHTRPVFTPATLNQQQRAAVDAVFTPESHATVRRQRTGRLLRSVSSRGHLTFVQSARLRQTALLELSQELLTRI